MNSHAPHVMQGMMHNLIVLESIQDNRKHLKKIARALEQYKTPNTEARLIARKAAEGMRKIAESLSVAEKANGDACKCLGAIVTADLSEWNERQGEPTGASDGENASPDSGRATPATTSAPTPPMTMNPIDSFPPPDMPLRARLPEFRPETREKLVTWALWQPGSMPWLLKRAADYWDKFPTWNSPADDAANGADLHHARIEAACALELARHRTQCADDRAVVEHISAPLNDQAER